MLIFYIDYDDFYDVCIVDVRCIMTKGRFTVDRHDHNEIVLAEQSRAEQSRAEQSRAEQGLTAPFLRLAIARRLKLNTIFVMDDRRT